MCHHISQYQMSCIHRSIAELTKSFCTTWKQGELSFQTNFTQLGKLLCPIETGVLNNTPRCVLVLTKVGIITHQSVK